MHQKSDGPQSPEEKMIHAAVDQLSEHFDTVQIFVTLTHEKLSGIDAGAGNFMARYGYVKQWSEFHDERIRQDARVRE